MWRYEIEGIIIERHVLFLHGQNTVHVTYKLISDQERIQLRAKAVHNFAAMNTRSIMDPTKTIALPLRDRDEITRPDMLPTLRLVMRGENAAFTYDGGTRREIFYPKEAEPRLRIQRAALESGSFSVELARRRAGDIRCLDRRVGHHARAGSRRASATLPRTRLALSLGRPEARAGCGGRTGAGGRPIHHHTSRPNRGCARAQAAGDEVRTVIAGYHWFTDWGRDTMISLEGLTLTTGRHHEAGWIFRTFAHYIRDGLIPNMFPEGKNEGLYHTADATLWFFHALDRYVDAHRRPRNPATDPAEAGGYRRTSSARHTIRHPCRSGGRPARQGEEGYQLTWMDAKVDDWVVTPRRGKAVEINGLWYNALRLLETGCVRKGARRMPRIAEHAQRASESFNQRFWYEQRRLSLRCGRRTRRR